MSKAVVFLALAAIVGLYIYGQPKTMFSDYSVQGDPGTKCTTPGGQIYYGKVPAGVQCAKTEPVDGAVTVLQATAEDSGDLSTQTGNFKCDGRRYCSQMKSCAEAIFFLKNCPNTEVDGDFDGVPCEEQWCES